ncbi:glycosyl hydrolase [Halomarina oriensis]|uniref:Glycosyl hydrolase n=1 Tax=Halomarina oriensis TaxID=671145 RepID=A0A6B0GE38_9EURY|nr:glycosyl hydrolase [Halomarina oriensis]MWG33206.1 glycosyl hydrolase [Halomarina oriensis]
MRLHGIHDGRLYASTARTLYTEQRTNGSDGVGRFVADGDLPNPRLAGWFRRELFTGSPWRLLSRLVGRFPTTNVWRDDAVTLATLNRWLVASHDGERTWTPVYELPRSSGPMGVLPTACCRDGDRLLLGEYPLGADTAHLLVSTDDGRSWRRLLAVDGVRHVHSVLRDPYTDDVWVTTGDRDSESRLCLLRDGEKGSETASEGSDDAGDDEHDGPWLDVVGTGSQRWRAVDLAFTEDAVLWGMDCLYADENRIQRLDRETLAEREPGERLDEDAIETVGVASGSVFYAETWDHDGEQYVALVTATETGTDSTADGDRAVNRTGTADVLVSSSASGFERWETLASYQKKPALADSLPGVESASGYVYVAADERGLFVNPFNTAEDDGKVLRVSSERVASLLE